jgi:hypothetical protein
MALVFGECGRECFSGPGNTVVNLKDMLADKHFEVGCKILIPVWQKEGPDSQSNTTISNN